MHFRYIYDGLLFRRFRSQVMGDPKKITGGVRELLERIYREWDSTVNGMFTAKIFCGR